MTDFRTTVETEASSFDLTYKKKTMLVGSCFTDNIGNMLQYYKFPVKINPFGVMYNPVSVARVLDILMNRSLFTEEDLHQHNHTWLSFYHDTSFSGEEKAQVLKTINKHINEGFEWLRSTNMLILTFGTARVYQHRETENIVSNCHKIPARAFNRFMLEVDEIVEEYRSLLENLKQFNPGLHIVLTISPVRHWKDGAVKNQQSKAALILAVQKLREEFPEIEYFPSYEIMMDELRDYRFYAEDMIHPGKTGIRYLWERFADTYIKKSTFKTMSRVEEIVRASRHRPFKPHSLEYQNFLKKQIEKTEQFMYKHPHINLQDELNHFISQLERGKKMR